METSLLYVAVDIGGTFTDLVAFDDVEGRLYHAKRLTTHDHLVNGILDCIDNSGLALNDVTQLIHGSTVAINTLIERQGARTALLVTKGTRDVYAIGRGNRPDAYNLFFARPKPLAPRAAIFEVDERLIAGGAVARPLVADEIKAIARQIKAEGYEAVAVCFLHSYANTAHEEAAGAILARELAGPYISLSHKIMREYREYERISTTAVNAYIGPKISGYVGSLEAALHRHGFNGELSIMQSNGGVMSPEVAAIRPVMMMESGPVGGIIACAQIAGRLGYPNSISFDMGGTTAKASLVKDYVPSMTEGYYVGGYQSGDPVMIPVVDIVEVGAGGGSIAWIDDVGALKVGPRSAGSSPGPICYGLGGQEPTITDANVILGRLDPSGFLGGDMRLDADAARKGIACRIAAPLKMEPETAARAIIAIAVATMSLAVRQVSVERGYDPRDFALVASGGAGPLHAVAIARELRIPVVVIPWFPSHFSALGMLMADERHDIVRTYPAALETLNFSRLAAVITELASDLKGMTRTNAIDIDLLMDLRYVGQEFSLSVTVSREQIVHGDRAGIRRAFDELHKSRYEHNATDEPVEMMNIRLVARAPRAKPTMPKPGTETLRPRQAWVSMMQGPPVLCHVVDRGSLKAGESFNGPALIQEYGSTTVLYENDRCDVAPTGELIITLGQ